ncbi:MAG TPA: type II toxin-antitoxin system HicA family toxin [Kamptonema sp.]|nr:type II toxin-antitoxin system HicA family toxin [Kamptonema sp.]
MDVPKEKVIRTLNLEWLGFMLIRDREHIVMVRYNDDGTRNPLTIPNHDRIKGSTLRAICTQSGIPQEEFLNAYEES